MYPENLAKHLVKNITSGASEFASKVQGLTGRGTLGRRKVRAIRGARGLVERDAYPPLFRCVQHTVKIRSGPKRSLWHESNGDTG